MKLAALSALVLGAVAVVGGSAIFVAGRLRATAGSAVAPEESRPEVGLQELSSLQADIGRGTGVVLEVERQREVARSAAVLTCYVRDAQGEPIAGARVSWTPLLPEFLGVWVGWANQRWPEIEAATFEVISAQDGGVEFTSVLPGMVGMPSALWATHEHYLPVLAHVGWADGQPQLPAVLEMTSGEPIEARVVDTWGTPVEGAAVEQMTPVPTSARADEFDPQARRVLRRSATTDERGVASLASWDGPLLLRATHGGLASEAWIGTPRPAIELVLCPTFEAGGSVVTDAGSVIEGEQRIVCQVQKGSQLQPLAVLPVAGGAWGPVALPLLEADAYRFRLEGWNAEVHERTFDPPAAGASLQVDFTLRAGIDLVTFVQDEEKEPIRESTSIVSWEQDGLSIEAKGHPREDGHTFIRGIPPGVVRLTAEAPAFVPEEFGNLKVPEDPPMVLEITLKRGRRLEGRVLSRGQPVEDFEITFWPEYSTDHTVVHFRERSDGSFVLDVPTSQLWLTASASRASPSEVAVVAPSEQSPAPLVLELRELVRGRGQVVDAATGEPLPSACIQPFIAGDFTLLAGWGPTLEVERDGTFDFLGFAPGRQSIRFSAPGYSVHCAETAARPGEEIDFGIVPLGSRKDLVVELVADGEQDFSHFILLGGGTEPIGEERFSSDGRVVVERASAGRYWLLISDGEDLGLHERINLRPTDDWHYMFPVGGAHRLRISVDRNAALPSDTYFAVALPHPARPGYVVTAPMNPERVFEVASPHVGGFQAEIFARNGSTIASANGEIRAEDTLIQVLLDVEAAGQRFRIVGAQGQPVPHVSIRLFSPDGAHQKAVESADERGECLIKGLEPGDYQAYMEHLELGYHFGVPVDVPPPSAEPVEVRFLPEGVVELQLMDGFEPLPALPCYLVGERGFYTLPPATSDSSGIVRWQSVGRGRFLARIRQPGFWPTETTVETRPPGERTEVQVRRLGDLDLQVERASGGAAGGVVLELESAEFAVSVADWITEGKAMSSTGTLAVDSHGQLSLTGLPRGTYRWAAEGASGTVEVLPERRGEFTILLP